MTEEEKRKNDIENLENGSKLLKNCANQMIQASEYLSDYYPMTNAELQRCAAGLYYWNDGVEETIKGLKELQGSQ